MDSNSTWVVLVSVVIGTLLGGVIQAATARYAAFKEGSGIAAALSAEIKAITDVVSARRYLEGLDLIIQQLEANPQAGGIEHYFSPRIGDDHFLVFQAIAPKIGLLGDASSTTVKAYQFALSILDDIRVLEEQRRRVEDGKPGWPSEWLLFWTRELRLFFAGALVAGNEAVLVLERRRTKSWLSR